MLRSGNMALTGLWGLKGPGSSAVIRVAISIEPDESRGAQKAMFAVPACICIEAISTIVSSGK